MTSPAASTEDFYDSPTAPENAPDEAAVLGHVATFPIVGIGASAGGLEAFTQLLQSLPPDTGMAYVLVQHLAPSHPSALAEILSRSTKMQVLEVHDETTVEPNHVYVIPPGRSMSIAGGALQLLPREGRGVHHPIDQFFRTLAQERRHQAIGVVLSGTASDGTLGLEEIKAEGGITFAQDTTAQHDGMPQSAIASGNVDFVLAPDEIARELVQISEHAFSEPGDWVRKAEDRPNLAEVLQLLRHVTGVDFTGYRYNTLFRRVTRRMVFRKTGDLAEYVQFLREKPLEVEALYQDILINVTGFFRDKESFEALKTTVFPRILKGRARYDTVRLWTLGCATGQEAYSLAMTFIEAAEAAGSSVALQVFATDLNAAGVEKARMGVYPKTIAQEVSPDRLRRFFTEVDGHYRISKTVRDACVFSRHNVLADPPFSRMDLISCRNLLIYLEPVLQQKIIPTLHYALKPTGCLWLGGSETIGPFRTLFDSEDAKHKIYIKKSGSRPGAVHFPLTHSGVRSPFTPITALASEGPDLHKEADRILLAKFAPPGVLVSADLEILQYKGDTGLFMAPAPGKASLNLLKMLREGLLVDVRAAVLRAGNEQMAVRQEGLRVKSNDGWLNVAVEVIPINSPGANPGGFLVLFEEQGDSRRFETARSVELEKPHAGQSPPAPEPFNSDPQNARLHQELAATRDYLQSLIEHQESANEELQSANEEVQSANEELQSTNEELETSKEEIQSSNEELITVNDELNNRNAELHRLNNDLVNLFANIQTAIVLVGPDLRVRRFTPAAEKLLKLTPADLGRSLSGFKDLDDLADLETLMTAVFDSASPTEHEIRDKQGRWYSLRLRPYRTLENRIDGVIVMLVDIDVLKRAYAYTESIVSTVREPLLVLDTNLRVRTASVSFYRTYRVTPEQTINKHFYELGNAQWNIPELRRVLDEVLPRSSEVLDFEVEHNFEQIGIKTMRLNACRLVQVSEHDPLILLAIEDVTEHKKQATELRQLAADLSEADHRKNEFLAMLAHELRNPLAPIRNALQILRVTKGNEQAVQSATEMMDRQIAQLVRLVDDLLDVSRITQGRIELRRARIELASLVYQAIEANRSLYNSLKQELMVSMPPEPIYLYADSARLAQVLGNLLNNACKFSDPGSRIWLTVELEEDKEAPRGGDNDKGKDASSSVSSPPGVLVSHALIRVRDRGIGIAPEQLDRIFEMFVQLDTTLERSISGLGIGLALVKQLVEMHGGTVTVRSEGVGKGSEFITRLPIMVEAATPPSARSIVNESVNTPAKRVLVVDDNRDSAITLTMLLSLKGSETQTAFDGVQALETAATFRPDVILLDIGLPKLNGYEVARQIREQPWGKTTVLVALTGWGQDEDRRKSSEAGFNGHLVKPVDHAALSKLLVELLPTPE